jgi:hypothetical protein
MASLYEFVDHERVYDWNFICLLHSYGIYVLDYTNIFLSFYCLCIINVSHYLPWTKHKHHQNHSKPKAQILSQFYSIKFYIHITKIFLSNENVSKGHKHSLIYIIKKKLDKKFLKVYTSHDPMWFHIHNKMQRLSNDLYII